MATCSLHEMKNRLGMPCPHCTVGRFRNELEYSKDLWRKTRAAVGEAYGEMDRFDDDPPEFIRWAHEHEQTEFWGRVKAEAALAAATKDAERLDWLENNVYVGFELEPEQGQEDHTNWRTAIDAAKGEK